jgi:hypothetical protein
MLGRIVPVLPVVGSGSGSGSGRGSGGGAGGAYFNTMRELGLWMESRVALGDGAVSKEALARFAAAEGSGGGGGMGAAGTSGTSTSTTSSSAALKHTRALSARDAQAVGKWMSMAEAALPPTTLALYEALLGAMGKYRGVLEKRSACAAECSSLSAANEALKAALSERMTGARAKKMAVHPAYTLRLGLATAGVVSSLAKAALKANAGAGAGAGGVEGGGGGARAKCSRQ